MSDFSDTNFNGRSSPTTANDDMAVIDASSFLSSSTTTVTTKRRVATTSSYGAASCSMNPCNWDSTCSIQNDRLYCSCPNGVDGYYVGFANVLEQQQQCSDSNGQSASASSNNASPSVVAMTTNDDKSSLLPQQQQLKTQAVPLEPVQYLWIAIPAVFILGIIIVLIVMACKSRIRNSRLAKKQAEEEDLGATIKNDEDEDEDDTFSDELEEDKTKKSLWSKTINGFASLRGSPPELYKAYLLKFLDAYSYTSFSLIFALFLSEDFGFTDVQAGTYYGLWGALITLYGIMVGTLVDNIGVALSLRLGFLLSLIGRVCIFLTTSRVVLLINVLVTLPLGGCLGIPVLTTGIRRYTHKSNRGFAYGLFYVIMNLASLLAGPVVDFFTIWYNNEEENGSITTTASGWTMTNHRAILLTGIITNVFACIVTFTVREIKVNQSSDDSSSVTNSESTVSQFTPKTGSVFKILKEITRTPSFRRFVVVCFITLNVRMIFRHLDATLPKFMVREFGEDVPKGTIYSINPALIVILVPIITAATTKVDPLVMIHYGTYVSAASVFFLAFSTTIWATIMFVIFLSIGEAMWSPRLYDYTMSVCQEGREGTFMALASAPLFLAKLPVGFLSGFLLERFCPEEGERQSQTMWLIIGLITASSPILLTCLWGYVSKKDDVDEVVEEEVVEEEKQSQKPAGLSAPQGALLYPGAAEQ